MSRRERMLDSGNRPVPVRFVDPVAASPIEVAAGGIIITVLGIIGLVWGAATLSAWLVVGERPDIGVTEAALAVARFGQNRLQWDGAWDPVVAETLAGPWWFWGFFAAEALIVALAFWPLWRLFGPRPAEPMPVFIEPRPPKHPRTERRLAAREEAKTRARRIIPTGEVVAVQNLAPTIDNILIRNPGPFQLVLGRSGKDLVVTNNFHSVIVFGPTQSGKTSSLTVPAILDWDGPALIITAKSDVVSLTWNERTKRGGRSWLFDPMSTMAGAEANDIDGIAASRGSGGHGWSPLNLIEAVPQARNEPELDRRVQQWGRARRTAQWMVAAARTNQGQGEMPEPWFVAAEQMLAPILLAAVTMELSIGDVAAWVDRRETDAVKQALDISGVPEANAAWDGARNSDPTTLAGTYQILAMIMSPYGDPRVLAQARRAEINGRQLLNGEPNTLFLLYPPGHQRRLRPLMTTLVSEVLESAMGQATGSPAGRLRMPLLVVFDDAAGCAPLQLLDQLASVGAGLGIQVVSIFQDLGNIARVFGADSAIQLANNHRARVVLPGVSDAATLDYINRLIKGTRLAGSSSGVADGATTDPVVVGAPTWMRTLHDGDALCVYGNLPPVRMALRPWFTDAGLRAMIEPPVPRERGMRRWRRRRELVGGGFPNPLDSESNDREASRYWEQVVKDGTLPDARPYDGGSTVPPPSL